MQNTDYCKEVFKQNFAVLRHKNKATKDKPGPNRYYTNEIFFGNYLLTSQWYEYQWDPFLNWLKKIKKVNSLL